MLDNDLRGIIVKVIFLYFLGTKFLCYGYSITKILMSQHQDNIMINIPDGDEIVTKTKKFVSKNRHDVLKAKYKCLKKLFQVYDASIIGILPPNTSDDNSFEQADNSCHYKEDPLKQSRKKYCSRNKMDASDEESGDSKPIESFFLEDTKELCSCATQVAPSTITEDNIETKMIRDNLSISIMGDSGNNFYSSCANSAAPQPRKLTRFQRFLFRLFGSRRKKTYVNPLSHNCTASEYNVCHTYAYGEKRRSKVFRCRRLSMPKKTQSDMQRQMNYPPLLEYVQTMQQHCLLDRTPRTCPITGCDNIFYGIINYNDHLNLCHFNDRKFICHYCHEGFRQTNEKYAHENEHLGISQINKNLTNFSNIPDIKNNNLTAISNSRDVKDNSLTNISNIADVKNNSLTHLSNIPDVKNNNFTDISNTRYVKDNSLTNISNNADVKNNSLIHFSNIPDVKNNNLADISNTRDVKDNSLTNISNIADVKNNSLTHFSNIPDVKNNYNMTSFSSDVKNQSFRSCITQTEAETSCYINQENKLKKMLDKSQNFEVMKPGRSETYLRSPKNKTEQNLDKKTVSCSNFLDKLRFVTVPFEFNDSGISRCPCESLLSKCHCCGQNKNGDSRGQLNLHTESGYDKRKKFQKLPSYPVKTDCQRKHTRKQGNYTTHNHIKLKTGKIDIQTRHDAVEDHVDDSFMSGENYSHIQEYESTDTLRKGPIHNSVDKRKRITIYRWEPGTKIIRV